MHSKHFGGIKFGGSEKDRQTAKFKSPPNFPAIRYIDRARGTVSRYFV